MPVPVALLGGDEVTDLAEFYGLTEEDILAEIENGRSLTEIATALGHDKSMLSRWLNADEQRSARARDARILAASSWDDAAEDGIRDATDPFELAKAKELAHHYRWRASKIAPAQYGEKLELGGTLGLKRAPTDLTDAELEAIIRAKQKAIE